MEFEISVLFCFLIFWELFIKIKNQVCKIFIFNTYFYFIADTIYRSTHSRFKKTSYKKNDQFKLCRECQWNPLLSLSIDSWFWRIRMGLDYCSKKIWSKLLFWRMSVSVVSEIRTYPCSTIGQPAGEWWTVLCTEENVFDIYALFWPGVQYYIWSTTWNGSWSMWMLLTVLEFFIFINFFF